MTLLFVLPFAPAAAQQAPSVYAGVAATTNYIYRGETQSDDRPALQGYIESELGMLYAGAWASTVDLDDDRAELELYVGVRRSFGDLSADLSYIRYLYDQSGDCCGEIGLALAHPFGHSLELGAALFVDPEESTEWFEATAGVTILENYLLDATVGSDFGSLDYGKDKVAWNLGASRTFSELATVDLRYHDANVAPARLVGSVSLDF